MGEPRPRCPLSTAGDTQGGRAAGCGQTPAARGGDLRVGDARLVPAAQQGSSAGQRQGKGPEALCRRDGTGPDEVRRGQRCLERPHSSAQAVSGGNRADFGAAAALPPARRFTPTLAPQLRCPGSFPGGTKVERKGLERGGDRRERGLGRGRCEPDPLIPARPAQPEPGSPSRTHRRAPGSLCVPTGAAPLSPSRVPRGMQRAAPGQGQPRPPSPGDSGPQVTCPDLHVVFTRSEVQKAFPSQSRLIGRSSSLHKGGQRPPPGGRDTGGDPSQVRGGGL